MLRLDFATRLVPIASLIFGMLCATECLGQSQSEDTTPKLPVFEVASIKPNKSGTPMIMFRFTPDGVMVTNSPLKLIIQQSYGVEENQIVSAPSWVNSERFDVEAKVDSADAPKLRDLKPKQRMAMLQPVLADRFRLKVHRETRELPVYELVVAKQGFKLTPTDGRSCTTRDLAQFPRPPFDPSQKQACGTIKLLSGPHKVIFDLPGATVTEFSKYLPDVAGRPVVDKTGINGLFNFHMEFARGGVPSSEPSADNDDVQSVFSALAQIGLRLQPAKGSKEFLVIDSIARPSAN